MYTTVQTHLWNSSISITLKKDMCVFYDMGTYSSSLRQRPHGKTYQCVNVLSTEKDVMKMIL